MYKSMLNKFVAPKPRDLVDYDVYMERRTSTRARVPVEKDDATDCCESSLVLFYSGLRQEAQLFGLLEYGSASDLWEVIMRNVDIRVEDDSLDAECPSN